MTETPRFPEEESPSEVKRDRLTVAGVGWIGAAMLVGLLGLVTIWLGPIFSVPLFLIAIVMAAVGTSRMRRLRAAPLNGPYTMPDVPSEHRQRRAD